MAPSARRVGLLLAPALSLCLAPVGLRAAELPGARLAGDGVAAYKRGDLQGAAHAFGRAYLLRAYPGYATSAAKCLLALGDTIGARLCFAAARQGTCPKRHLKCQEGLRTAARWLEANGAPRSSAGLVSACVAAATRRPKVASAPPRRPATQPRRAPRPRRPAEATTAPAPQAARTRVPAVPQVTARGARPWAGRLLWGAAGLGATALGLVAWAEIDYAAIERSRDGRYTGDPVVVQARVQRVNRRLVASWIVGGVAAGSALVGAVLRWRGSPLAQTAGERDATAGAGALGVGAGPAGWRVSWRGHF